MPLITITSHPGWYPTDFVEHDSPKQCSMMDFASELPGLFSKNAGDLGMDPCPPDGVQVNFELFHSRAINAPRGVWIKIEMAEVLERIVRLPNGTPVHTRDEATEAQVTAKLKELLRPLLDMLDGQPQIAVDIFWGPDHGWLDFGETKIDW